MQYSGTIYVKFKEREPWEKTVKDFKMTNDGKTVCLYDFVTDDGTPQADGMFGNFSKSFEFFSNGAHISAEELSIELDEGWNEDNLETLADMFIKAVGSEAVILAYTFNLSTDPYVYMIYSVGGEKHTEYKSGRAAERQENRNISDIEEWLKDCSLSAEEKEFLGQFIELRGCSESAEDANGFAIENGVLKEYNGLGADEDIPADIVEDMYDELSEFFTSVAIPDNVTSIGDGAFAECGGIASITIPDGVRNIGESAFSGCSSLTNIIFGENSKLTSIGESAFSYCSSLTSIIIPDSVTSIGDGAFEECSNLTSVTIGNGVKSIGNCAFEECEDITSITIPNSVRSIGSWAFSYCSSLTSITIPDSVRSIGNDAFKGCTSLTSITFDENSKLMSIDENAFSGAAYYNNDANWTDGVLYIENHLIKAKANKLTTNYTVKAGTKCIAGNAFYKCRGLTSITIPDSVRSIGNDAFKGCTSLTNITFGENSKLTSIGKNAFSNCKSLASITIPDSVRSIGNDAFKGCTSLTSIAFDENSKLMSIDENAFSGAAYYNNDANWTDGVLYIGNHLIKAKANKLTTNYTVKAGTKCIAGNAFYKCRSLTSITIPNSVRSIGNDAFYDCRIETATIPALAAEYIGNSKLKTVIITSGTSIGGSAFSYCSNLTSITIPDSVKSISKDAFKNCTNLRSATFCGTVEQFLSIKGYTQINVSEVVCSDGTAKIKKTNNTR